MKKAIAVLLLVVAGAGIFYVLQKKQRSTDVISSNQQMIKGAWQLDRYHLSLKDTGDAFTREILSDLKSYRFNFLNDSIMQVGKKDSVAVENTRYTWQNADEFVWQESATDSAGTRFQIVNVNKDSMQLQTSDSLQLFFKRPTD